MERNGFAPRPAAPAQRKTFQEREKPVATAPSVPPARNLKRIAATGKTNTHAAAGHATAEDLVEGATVEHERFGKGKVVRVEGQAPDQKATIFFPSAGQKQLLLRFAKLKLVNG